MRLYFCRPALWLACAAGLSWFPRCAGADSATKVELRCKIGPPGRAVDADLWQLQLRGATGEPVRQLLVMGGQTVEFKDLEPGIYVVCLYGTRDRQSCRSLDLNMPEPGRPHRFLADIQIPKFSNLGGDGHTVTTSELSVPPEARAELVAAEKAQLAGRVGAARRRLERALEIFPDFTDALNNLGTMHFRAGDFGEATELFTRATALDPEFYEAWVNLAGSLTSMARFDDAMTAVRNALRLRPNEALANSHAGLICFYRRDFGCAKTYFEKALALDPASTGSPQLFLAHISLAEHRMADAEAYYRKYLEVHPNAPDANDLRRLVRSLETGDVGVSEATASAN